MLLAKRIAPARVRWLVAGEDDREDDLFAVDASESATGHELNVPASPAGAHDPTPAPDAASDAPAISPAADTSDAIRAPGPAAPSAPAPRVPAFYLELCRRVVLHRDSGRFDLLYRLLWRLLHEPGLRHDPLDADRMEADRMARVVRRDMHKMTAFVRFRTVHPGREDAAQAKLLADDSPLAPDTELLHLAWFEPEHHIVAAIAPFFVRRFTGMHWAILTPQASIEWIPASLGARDAASWAPAQAAGPGGRALTDITPPAARRRGLLLLGPGATRQSAPAPDAGEALWLTYYAHIFNPARLKLKMMQKEMPRRYWHNLPEAQLIAPLAAAAHQRSAEMIEQAPTVVPARRLPRQAGRPDPAAAQVAAGNAESDFSSPEAVLTISRLKAATDRCRACPIGEHATQSVAGAGPAGARLMVVGEQPGDQEDLRGTPFVGPAGRLFDRALAQLGWPRETLYITNAVKHFKFELRGQRRIHKTPAQQEVAACLQWLERERELVRPRAILALGATAARAVLGRPVAVMKERGQWHTDPHGIPVLVTLHPSALLRADPAQSAEDFSRWLQDLSAASSLVVADQAPVPPHA